jgi:hypothetical protein
MSRTQIRSRRRATFRTRDDVVDLKRIVYSGRLTA